MASLAILVMHSGRWDNDNCYVDYTIEGVIFKESSSYKELYNVIAMQLGFDTNLIKLKLEYRVKESKTPMLIHNDMGVRVYIMLKKSADDFNKYPICISKMDNSSNITELCESSNQENDMVISICNDSIADFETMHLSISELVEPLCVLGLGSCDGVISDPCNKYVEIDQVYKNKATLKSVMQNYAIENRFQYRTVRSNAISYTLECISDECEWLMKASNISKSGMFRIRAFNTDHTCPLKDKVYSQKHATSKLIGGIVKPKFVDHKRKYTPSDIRSDVKIYLGVDVNYSLAWRAKEKALISLRGTTTASYSKLPAYLPVIVVDGSHLRGPYNGTFVVASTMDGAETHRGWAMTSNIAESINVALVSARELPIFNFLEEVVPSTEYIYNVTDDGRSFVVCLKNKTCSCEKFQYEEIPCEHAWAVLKRKSLVADGYCSDLYKPKTVLNIYEIPIYPLPDVAEWVIPEYIMYDEVRPLKFKRPPGRPKNKPRSKTKRELLGLKGKHTCSTCGVVGHNRRSGRNRPQEV
ncbi:hypothetical protein KY290_037114 [Solanum tuberosum]|uniref:SWIM-type domain-containing protein n=1 Tax=Solanum tuberosum TaxID=4113 RepID=A0ABQ7TWH9_SOLTU|nr:hypothetical protein KY290_037114 [Solanum tuberosum]